MIDTALPLFLQEVLFDSSTEGQVKTIWIILLRDLNYDNNGILYQNRVDEIQFRLQYPEANMSQAIASVYDDLVSATLIEPFLENLILPDEIHASIDELLYISGAHPPEIERAISNILAAGFRHRIKHLFFIDYVDTYGPTGLRLQPRGSFAFQTTILPEGETLRIQIQASPHRIRITRYDGYDVPTDWIDFMAQQTSHLARYIIPFEDSIPSPEMEIMMFH